MAQQLVTLQIDDDLSDNPYHQITAHSNLIKYQARKSLALPLSFSNSDGLASARLTFQLHYDSSLFTFVSIDNPLQELNDYSTSADIADADDDPSTDGSQRLHWFICRISCLWNPVEPTRCRRFLTGQSKPITGLRSSVMNLTASETSKAMALQQIQSRLKLFSSIWMWMVMVRSRSRRRLDGDPQTVWLCLCW